MGNVTVIMFFQEFRTRIRSFTNGYEPIFPQSSYNIILPVPLPAAFTIIGDCGVTAIEAEDFDYNDQYNSNVEFVLSKEVEKLQVSSKKSKGKNWSVSLTTTETFKIERPLTFNLTARVSLFLMFCFLTYAIHEMLCNL
jgi:hypothetical protein